MNCLMQSESKFLPDFSHIYIESGAKDFDLTQKCIKNFPKAKVIIKRITTPTIAIVLY